jgi:signal transduction histidine kinase
MSEASGQDALAALRHDLANLLMTVRGYAELMLIRDGLDPQLRHYPQQIVTAVDRAAAMLDEMHKAREASGYLAPPRDVSGLGLPAAK